MMDVTNQVTYFLYDKGMLPLVNVNKDTRVFATVKDDESVDETKWNQSEEKEKAMNYALDSMPESLLSSEDKCGFYDGDNGFVKTQREPAYILVENNREYTHDCEPVVKICASAMYDIKKGEIAPLPGTRVMWLDKEKDQKPGLDDLIESAESASGKENLTEAEKELKLNMGAPYSSICQEDVPASDDPEL